jgi:hypothetical protein
MRLRANEQAYEVVGRPAGVTLSPDADRGRYRDEKTRPCECSGAGVDVAQARFELAISGL